MFLTARTQWDDRVFRVFQLDVATTRPPLLKIRFCVRMSSSRLVYLLVNVFYCLSSGPISRFISNKKRSRLFRGNKVINLPTFPLLRHCNLVIMRVPEPLRFNPLNKLAKRKRIISCPKWFPLKPMGWMYADRTMQLRERIFVVIMSTN